MGAPASVALDIPIPADLLPDFIGKLHYVSPHMFNIAVAPSAQVVRFELKPGSAVTVDELTERIREVARVLCDGKRDFEAKVLVDRLNRLGAFAEDPHPLLMRSNHLFEYGPGRCGLGPMLVKLIDQFQADVTKELARPFAAQPHQFPSLIGADLLHQCKYLKSFPQSLNLVAHLKPDLDSIQDFARQAEWTGDSLTVAPGTLAEHRVLLSPSVCFHCYRWLAGTSMSANQSFSATGKCFRYESGNMRGLERLWDFTMREVIWVGDDEYVHEQRQRAISLSTQMLDKWGLAYQIKTATDPFFIDSYGMQAAFQRAFDLKFEVLAPLPYKGANAFLAIGSFNFHQEFFGRAFNIKTNGGEAASTGCLGFGLERVALAFLAQHGVDPAGWPAAVARAYQSA